ncbi:MAG TPA: dipicolinate synthase subunit DpsA [Clostridiales bacterium]|nr:MAG: hypothetical protein A2Y22_02245 [Clostridiales bacterium GWD2_32_59]HAN10336.1 dipicolinate synthase subunit DpsA [Clostridiales bacterium]
MQNIIISIIGGDIRHIYLANLLIDRVKEVKVFGLNHVKLDPRVNRYDNVIEAINKADIVIGPIPFSTNDKTIKASLYNKDIYIEELFISMTNKQKLISSNFSETATEMATNYKINIIDLNSFNEFAILNAIATAEGAIKEAIEASDISLHGSEVLVLGFGRCAKVLADKLQGIRAKVSVTARKKEDLAYIEAYGYTPIDFKKMNSTLDKYDYIFNSIPKLVLDESMLCKVKKDCIVIDIASSPGGVDFYAAEKLDVKAILSLGIPGKVSPKTSAEIMWRIISDL